MEQYTWGQFWTVAVIFVVIYYGVVYLVYYLPKKKSEDQPTKNNNDSNNINKSDNNITIFDSPFIGNFDETEGDQDEYSERKEAAPVPEVEEKQDIEGQEEFEEDDYVMIGFEEEDVIFDHGDISGDDMGDDGNNDDDDENYVELEEDLYDVTWESYTPGEQINLDFDKNNND